MFNSIRCRSIRFPKESTLIVHVDMDAFYASVEIRDNPSLQGKPVVVGGNPHGRGVVSAASYEARKYGIHSAMPSSLAIRQCPKAVFIQSRISHYAKVSEDIHRIFDRFTSLVEPLSLDEAFLDVSGSNLLFGNAKKIAEQIKSEILAEIGLVASAGVANNKYIAKIASDLEKPNGLVVVTPENNMAFLEPLSISRIWGVGKKCEARLSAIGIHTIGQLRQLGLPELKSLFGKNGQQFWNLARGIDQRQVIPDRSAKTISHERTFPKDVTDRSILEANAIELMGQIARRVRQHDLTARTVILKIKFSDFKTVTRSKSIQPGTDVTHVFHSLIKTLVTNELPPVGPPIRLIGVSVSNLSCQSAQQLDLFSQKEIRCHSQLDRTTDDIVARFGQDAIRSANALQGEGQDRPKP
ncbi:MAG: DNA polymerase IV [Pirellulaceae bacterium]|nr:DNA polymerase IV [Pirellulaceae bacterium]